MRIQQILEAKFLKPITMFHGTSSNFLKSILKHGMVPNPKDKKWDTDDQVSLTASSLVSLEGSYWASNLFTAKTSADSTVDKFGGNIIIVIAQIQTGAAKADEDNISYTIPKFYDYAFGGIYSKNPTLVAQVFYNNKNYYEQKKKQFVKEIHSEFTDNKNKPIPTDLLEELFDTFSLRVISYGIKDAKGDDYHSPLKGIKPTPNIPSTDEMERELLIMKDKLTKYYRETAKDTGQSRHTLRITEPVTFGGASRITHIVEIPKNYKIDQTPLILHYGSPSLPREFMEQYINRVGKFPGLVDKNGNPVNKDGESNET